MKRIAILGAGPAGISLAYKIRQRSDLDADIIVIEKEPYPGGLSASFDYKGLSLDYGSHRLHPVMNAEILKDIHSLLGPDLLNRPRRGRIRLCGRYVEFPLEPLDCLLHLPPAFTWGVALDLITKPFRNRKNLPVSYAGALLGGLGKTICRNFYFPYASKIWGLDPEKIAAEQARRRIHADRIGKVIGRILTTLLRPKSLRHRYFFYPRRGFGQIARAMAQKFKKLGGKILLSTTIQDISLKGDRPFTISFNPSHALGDKNQFPQLPDSETLGADFVFSTLPLNSLMSCLRPRPPADVQAAARHIRYRAIVLCYLILKTDQFTPYDAHYFPENNVIFSRLSEPKNYSGIQEPAGITGLCVEIPCRVGGDLWNSPEDEIVRKVKQDLAVSGLSLTAPVESAFTRRLTHAYPIYDLNYEKNLGTIEDYIRGIAGMISLGRQGIFVHNNIHHVLEMSYGASQCLRSDYRWDEKKWERFRKIFQTSTVED